MANLLPIKQKQGVRREYMFRMASVSVFFTAFSVLAGTIFLMPTYLLSEVREKQAVEEQVFIRELVSSVEVVDAQTVLREAREKVSILSDLESQAPLQTVLPKILEYKPRSISITSIFYDFRVSAGATIAVRGEAENRDDLIAFSKRLERDVVFANVELPVSNLAKENDITFSLTLLINSEG
jgi:hypothetical protein|tara:strand:- start:4172 stop:4717 length:546 start_codon:yes stop_codon:yes gene_type:complete